MKFRNILLTTFAASAFVIGTTSCSDSFLDEKIYLTEHQFCQLLGRMRLYQSLPQGYQKDIPKMLITDSQINTVAKAYINDKNFGSLGNDISMWKLYNLLTGANKSSYIDSFLDRAVNATEIATGINAALHGDTKYKWFID